MRIVRSTDIEVRKSPSISATVYPKGYAMIGNDGNIWEIMLDNRGVHRWQRQKLSEQQKKELIEKLKRQIRAYKMLVEDDYEIKYELEQKVKNKIKEFEHHHDEVSKDSARLLREFLRSSFAHGGRIDQLNEKKKMYESALSNTSSPAQKEYYIKKINELDSHRKFN